MTTASDHDANRTARLTSRPAHPGSTSMWRWWRYVPAWRVMLAFAVVHACRYCPSLRVKNFFYRRLGVKIGARVSVGLGATVDVFFPQLISIGDDTIIGYNTVVLAHEFLVDELRTGPVEIGKKAMIGANCTILPGVRIGDGATVSACSLVNRDIPQGVMAGGVPARIISRSADQSPDTRSPRDRG